MRYADSLLSQGETVVLRQRQHWLALLLDARMSFVLWLVAAALLVAVAMFGLRDIARDVLSYAAIAFIAVGIVIFLYRVWKWWAQDYMVTNRRILKVEGILNKRSADSSLEKINDAVLEQNIVGRMLNYGDLDILTAADTSVDRYRMLNQAPRFKREMLNQKHALETEFVQRMPPSPPLRSRPVDMNGEPTPWSGDGRSDGAGSAGEAHAARAEPPAPPPPPVSVLRDAPTHEAATASGTTSTTTITAGDSDGSSSAASAAPLAAAAPPPPPMPPSGGTASADPAQITQTLARLADLRDRGAITAEEYEAKKSDLLSRL